MKYARGCMYVIGKYCTTLDRALSILGLCHLELTPAETERLLYLVYIKALLKCKISPC